MRFRFFYALVQMKSMGLSRSSGSVDFSAWFLPFPYNKTDSLCHWWVIQAICFVLFSTFVCFQSVRYRGESDKCL